MTFLKQRLRLVRDPRFNPKNSCYANLQDHVNAGRWEDMLKEYRNNKHTIALSSGAHNMLSLAYKKLGNEKAAKKEDLLGRLLLKELLKTGNGTVEKPY